MQDDLDTGRQVIRNEGRHTNAEVDVLAGEQFPRYPGGQFRTAQTHAESPARTIRRSIRLPCAPTWTTRWTKMPGVWICSGAISPGSTKRSTSAIVIRPAAAQSGLKFLGRRVIDQVAVAVPHRGPNEREVGNDGFFQNVAAVTETAESPSPARQCSRCHQARSATADHRSPPPSRPRPGCRTPLCRRPQPAASRPECPAG